VCSLRTSSGAGEGEEGFRFDGALYVLILLYYCSSFLFSFDASVSLLSIYCLLAFSDTK
jgi:hypothetical protein